MSERVTVSAAQQVAARMVIKRATARGRAVDPAVVKIANAKPRPRRTVGGTDPGRRTAAG